MTICSSVRLRLVMSQFMPTQPRTRPSSFRSGTARAETPAVIAGDVPDPTRVDRRALRDRAAPYLDDAIPVLR